MFERAYRKRLQADLDRWVGAGLITAAQGLALRTDSLRESGGLKLPGVLAMLGGLLLASSVAAFVAANWQAIPRVAKLAAILAAVLAAFLASARLERGGPSLASDAAATCGALCFAAGVALVGQMYHLPADWNAGLLLVSLGALVPALLHRSDGALLLGLAGLAGWCFSVTAEQNGVVPWFYPLLLAPCMLLALWRTRRIVHHAAVLAAALWLALLAGRFSEPLFGAQLAYWLGLSCLMVAVGALAVDRAWPGLLTAMLPWGLIGLMIIVLVQLFRILDSDTSRGGAATALAFAACIAALAASAAYAALARDRHPAWLLAGALVLALGLPLLFWSGLGASVAGRALVGAVVLIIAGLLVVAGVMSGMRRILAAGTVLFGIAVIVLLYRTVGTLLDQSLFFLIGGALMIGLAWGARKLLARIEPKPEAAA